MAQLKVNYLAESQIDSACYELLRKFAKAEDVKLAPPIPVDAVIERYFKVDLGFEDLKVLLGMTDVLGAS